MFSENAIRTALEHRVTTPGVLVRHEIGLMSHITRCDIATLTADSLSLYEIKSAADELGRRFARQVDLYLKVCNMAWAVVAPNHLRRTMALVPSWWGVLVGEAAPAGGVCLSEQRAATENPSPCRLSIARLLWSSELAFELRRRKIRGVSRLLLAQRAEQFAQSSLTLDELRGVVFGHMRTRTFGRGGFS